MGKNLHASNRDSEDDSDDSSSIAAASASGDNKSTGAPSARQEERDDEQRLCWTRDPDIVKLWESVLLQEINRNTNPYITCEALFQRIVRKMMVWFHLAELPAWNPEADLFQSFHADIKKAYDARRKNLTPEEQMCVERVLSKDAPQANELVKFATVWTKHDPGLTCRWFAVDGTLGSHAKLYVHEAFSSSFQTHAAAVRHLYRRGAGIDTPDDMKRVIMEAFDAVASATLTPAEVLASSNNSYLRLVGVEETKRMRDLRAAKAQAASTKSASGSGGHKRPKKEDSHPQNQTESRNGVN